MQSCSVLPPPPGALGALSLGLPLLATPDPVLRCVLPPEEEDGVCRDGDRGATAGARCIGAPIADCGAGAGVIVPEVGEPLVLLPPARWATAMLPARPQKPMNTSVKERRRCITGSPKFLVTTWREIMARTRR